jgi:hypothetical protein
MAWPTAQPGSACSSVRAEYFGDSWRGVYCVLAEATVLPLCGWRIRNAAMPADTLQRCNDRKSTTLDLTPTLDELVQGRGSPGGLSVING